MAERFRGKTDGKPTSPKDAGRNAVPQPTPDQPDVDAFLRQPRLSLTDEYWRPVDSLIPVRLTDMRDDTTSAPPARRRLRVLDGVIAAVGVAAALLLVVVLRQGDAHPKAPSAQAKTQLVAPRTIAVKATTSRHIAVAAPPVPAAAVQRMPAVQTAEPMTPVQPAGEVTRATQAEPAATSGPAPNAAVAASAPSSAVPDAPAAEPTHVKKRKHKRAEHAPPTASFPDP